MNLIWKNTNINESIKSQIQKEFIRVVSLFTEKFEKNLDDITITFNPRMRSRAGFANSARRHIEINQRLMEAHPDEVLPTFVHELCHIFTRDVYGFKNNGKRVASHGYQWQALMVMCGYEPESRHSMETAFELKQKRKQFNASCGCKTHVISSVRANKMKSGKARYSCRLCDEELRVVGLAY